MRCWGWVIAAALIACSSRSEDVDRARCSQLREHIIDVRLRAAKTSTTNDEVARPQLGPNAVALDLEAHRKALRQALGDDFLASCEKNLTAAEVNCALDAEESDVTGRCLTTSNR